MKNRIKVSLCSPPLTPTPTPTPSGAEGQDLSGQPGGAAKQQAANGGLINTLLQQSASTTPRPRQLPSQRGPDFVYRDFNSFQGSNLFVHFFAMGLFPSAAFVFFRGKIAHIRLNPTKSE